MNTASPRVDADADVARDIDRGVTALRRRVALGLFLGGFADGTFVLAIGLATLVLVGRVFGVVLAPSTLWLALFVVPALLGVWRVRTRGVTPSEAALHLDRRLSLAALLSTSAETDASAWSDRVSVRIRDAGSVLPRVRTGRLAARTLVPLAALLGVWCLPDPEVAPPIPPNPLFREALARLEQKIDLLERERVLEPEAVQEHRDRADALERKAEQGDATPWSDLDALAEKLTRATDEKSSALERLASDLAELASGRTGADGSKSAGERLAELANAARAAGLAPRISPELAKKLGLDRPGASIDPSLLSTDPATWKALAEALAAATNDRLAELARAGLVDGRELADLQKLLAGDPSSDPFEDGDKVCAICDGKRPEECGT